MILCLRQFLKKKSHTFDKNMVTKMNSDIKMNANPSYSITKQNSRTHEDEYEYDKISCQNNVKDTINMESNPSYGRVQGCNAYDAEYDVAIQSNPSYSYTSKEATMIYELENEDGYVETNLLSTQKVDYLKLSVSTTKKAATDDMDDVKINSNLSRNS